MLCIGGLLYLLLLGRFHPRGEVRQKHMAWVWFVLFGGQGMLVGSKRLDESIALSGGLVGNEYSYG